MGNPRSTTRNDPIFGFGQLAANGELLNYVAGSPFLKSLPAIRKSRETYLELLLAWLGDDYKTGGGTGEARSSATPSKKMVGKRADVLHHTIRTRGRVTWTRSHRSQATKIDWMQLRADEYPRDTAGRQPWRFLRDAREKTIFISMCRAFAAYAARHRPNGAPPSPRVNLISTTSTTLMQNC